MNARYHGQLLGVELANGRYQALPSAALGSLPDRGLVTAATDTPITVDSEGNAWLVAPKLYEAPAGRYQRVKAVYYRRERPGYAARRWRHALQSTFVALSNGRAVFRWSGEAGAAVACRRPPGDFICEG